MINLLTMLNKILVRFQRSTLLYWLPWHPILGVLVLLQADFTLYPKEQYCWDVDFQNQCVLKVAFW